ncbi:MAG TPA: hypothetical protein VF681_00130 [Abditibacteriaceae bacterium]
MSGIPPSTFPARLHVLLARDARYGVIIRRGPSKRVCTIGWNREDDSFTPGQWLKGRIYERRSDLSPDGRHLLYFAMNGHWDSEVKGAWTAISISPYLKAISLWAKGDCWHGGGLFIDKKHYWINDGYGHSPLKVTSVLKRVDEYPNYVYYGGECTGVYYLRLLRDGWSYKGEISKGEYHEVVTFEKPVNEHWILRKFAHATLDHPDGKGCYYDEHEMENVKAGVKIDGQNWEWADVDRRRVVWATDGKLFAGRLSTKDMDNIVQLHDFNSVEYERTKAPY